MTVATAEVDLIERVPFRDASLIAAMDDYHRVGRLALAELMHPRECAPARLPARSFSEPERMRPILEARSRQQPDPPGSGVTNPASRS